MNSNGTLSFVCWRGMYGSPAVDAQDTIELGWNPRPQKETKRRRWYIVGCPSRCTLEHWMVGGWGMEMGMMSSSLSTNGKLRFELIRARLSEHHQMRGRKELHFILFLLDIHCKLLVVGTGRGCESTLCCCSSTKEMRIWLGIVCI